MDALAVPSLFNRYTRSYYVSRDGRCRLTRDRALAFGPQTGGLCFQRRREIAYRRFEILELKVASADHAVAKRVLADLPYRPARFSKYTTGVELLISA
jgi:hypothetical protein